MILIPLGLAAGWLTWGGIDRALFGDRRGIAAAAILGAAGVLLAFWLLVQAAVESGVWERDGLLSQAAGSLERLATRVVEVIGSILSTVAGPLLSLVGVAL